MASVGGDGEQVELNIMPMLDIFSILILFLLMNFSTDPVSHDLNKGTELPDSLSLRSLDEVPIVQISKTAIFVNSKQIVALTNRKPPPSDVTQGAIFPLFKELEKIAELSKKFSKKIKNKDVAKKKNAITIEVDKGHNFGLIKKAMLAGQQAGFMSFKLMVSKLAGT